jgi:DHA2 family methylenomycin A resistance protein-like MFS transporter
MLSAVGIWAAGASLALTAGPLAGGTLITLAGWRSIFLVNIPIGLIGLWLTWRYADETPKSPRHHLDLPGQTAAVMALGCLAGALIEGGALGWTNGFVLAGFFVALIAAIAFVLIEARSTQPMLPLSLFRNQQFSTTALIGLLVNIAFYGLIFVLSLYFQQSEGMSALYTGLAFVPVMVVVFFPNLIAPRVAARIGARTTIATGAAITAASCLALLRIDHGTGYGAVVVQLMALGTGLGLLVPPLTSTLMGSVDKSRSGVAAAVLNSMRQTGSVLGVALFGSLVASTDLVPGLRLALIIAAALLASSATASMFGIPRTTK